jgi:hypothetical protein
MMRASISMRRAGALGVVSLAIVLAASCEIAGTTAPDVEPRAVVHAVLNPAATVQFVIVERTLRSASFSGATPERQPITNAQVVIYGPRQDSAIGAQVSGVRDGIYRITSVTITNGSAGTASPNVLRIRPGERYRLRVVTPVGVVTGETIVPVTGAVDASRRAFNVDRDTLRLDVSGVRNAAGYLLRHEGAGTAHERFTTSLDPILIFPLARASGDPDEQKWAFSFARGSMFPGVPQTFAVVAVDSNYFTYYVAGFDPFGDDTRGNSLTGGVGLFGAVASVMSKTVDLVADIDTQVEGSWTADRNSAALPLTMSLYSSPFFPGTGFNDEVFVSGTGRTFAGRPLQAFARMSGNGISVTFFDPTLTELAASTTGSVSSDALVLTDTRTGERVIYRKR